MYVVKNALRNISRAKGRNILFGIIVLIIAVSACLSLSIREAANTAKEEGLSELNITGNITLNTDKLMKNAGGSSSEKPDKSDMKKAMQGASSLSLSKLEKYAKCESVKDFYYTTSVSADSGSDDLEAVESSSDSNMPGGSQDSSDQSDFTITGYSSDEAMTDFVDGTSTIKKGSVFEENTSENQCIISSSLATYNDLSVGDKIKLTATDDDDNDVTFTLTVCGIYKTSSSSQSQSAGGGMMNFDSSNNIYMSYKALNNICESDNITGMVNGTYTFKDYSAYKKFKTEAHDAGLSSKYTVTSQDVNQYEQSLQPLNNLSKFATIFMIIVLVIGCVILFVLTLFNIRDRKYEIGALAAIGMKKKTIAKQFIYELIAVTFAALVLGTAIGGVTSVPITNSLLSSQITSQQEDNQNQMQQFGRESGSSSSDSSSSGTKAPSGNTGGGSSSVSSVSSATDFKVVLELLGIGMILTLLSGGIAVATVMRYDTLEILTDRD
mgnify:CR=1 FL=1